MIITPESSLKNLVETLDKVLVLLDEASEHFIGTVLNKEDLTEDIKKLEDKEHIKELMELLENYALMSGFLIDHPLISVIKKIREEYAKGYSGEELGAMRQTARGEIAGSQNAAERQLKSKMAKGGVGGARGAAISGVQAQQGVKTVADAERKMALDSANMNLIKWITQ